MASLVVWALVALVSCVPGAMALIAYAEGGTSLAAAFAFAVAVPAVGGFLVLRRERLNPDEQEQLIESVPPEMRERLRSALQRASPSRSRRG